MLSEGLNLSRVGGGLKISKTENDPKGNQEFSLYARYFVWAEPFLVYPFRVAKGTDKIRIS